MLWLEWSDEADSYRALFEYEAIRRDRRRSLRELCKRAVRPNAEAVSDQLADGTWITLSPAATICRGWRSAASGRLSAFERRC